MIVVCSVELTVSVKEAVDRAVSVSVLVKLTEIVVVVASLRIRVRVVVVVVVVDVDEMELNTNVAVLVVVREVESSRKVVKVVRLKDTLTSVKVAPNRVTVVVPGTVIEVESTKIVDPGIAICS